MINKNRKRRPHPYYTAYEPLLNLCLAILEHRKVRYSSEQNLIYGILFSGSWLWEEYLYVAIFSKLNFSHPDNRRKSNAIYIFGGKIDTTLEDPEIIEKNLGPRFPDYMLEESGQIKVVADAKYRHHNYCGDRDNLHQLLTYMYITKAEKGIFIYPIGSNTSGEIVDILKNEPTKQIKGYGGYYNRLGFCIPKDTKDFNEFAIKMKEEENRLISKIEDII